MQVRSAVLNSSKTWIMVKEDHLVDAKAAFQDTDIQFTTEGIYRPYLGVALGTRSLY